MPKLTEHMPPWVGTYIGIPFADRGRDRDGLDCWGLARLVYAERFGVMLPSLADGYVGEDRASVAKLFHAQSGVSLDETSAADQDPTRHWKLVQSPELGDLASFRIAGKHGHVAVLVSENEFLHAIAGVKSCVERLSSPLWNRRLVGFWRYAGPVRVAGRPIFMQPDSVNVELPAGLSIAELLEAAGIEMTPYLVVHVGDGEVPFEQWPNVKPKAGRVVTVSAVPRGGGGQGGGKTALRLVATIAVIALAAYVGSPAAGFFAAGSGWGAATTAAIGIVGSLAVNALIRPPAARLSLAGGSAASDQISPSISSGRNELRPYGVVPMAFGLYRWAPPYGAKPYVEVQGDAQYLRCLFNLGEGPLEVSDIKIGDTPITSYEGVEVEIRPGYLDDAPLTLFPNAVVQEDFSIALTQAGSWTSRTSALGAQELSVDVVFPGGLALFNPDGTKTNRAVEVAVEFRRVGDVPWLQVNGGGTNSGSPTTFREMDFLFRTPEATFGGKGNHANDVNWSASQVPYPDAKPAYLPSTSFAWKVEGYIYCPFPGYYQFCVDSNDAADVHVDGHEVASWYGSHATEVTQATLNSSTHAGAPIYLEPGWHSFRARVECRTPAGGALAVGWRTPIDGVFKIVPQSSLAPVSSGFGSQGSLNYEWYLTDGYRSSIFAFESRTDPIRRSLSWATPDADPSTSYEVRLRRITPDTDATNITDKVFWSALRTIEARDPMPQPGMAKLAVRIKATDQLNGIVDTLTVLTRSILDDWDRVTRAWVKRGTSNPASVYRRLLNGPPSSPVLPDARIDLDELARWHEESEDRGLRFNGVIDFSGTLYERLQDIAAAGRATPGMKDSRFSIVRDRPQTVPIQHFTPGNSRGFSGRKTFADLPHAFRVRFMDAALGYQQNERIVPDDYHAVGGLTAFGEATSLPEANRIETLEVFGCSSMDEAFRHGRYHLAVAQLRPEAFELSTDAEHLVATRGDLVLVTHDVPLWGQAWGRVTGLVTDLGGNLIAIRTDEQLTMDGGQLYRVRVRLESGATWLRDVVTVAGITHELTLATPEGAANPKPKVGDLFMFGPPGLESRELIIKGIEIDRDLGAKLTFVDHAPAVHLADQGVIPPYDSGITGTTKYEERPEDPVITSIRSDDLVMIRSADGSLLNRMLISLLPVSGRHPFPVAVQSRTRPKPAFGAGDAGSWTTHPQVSLSNNSFGITDVEQGITYQIKIRTVSAQGVTSHWVAAEHTIVGKTFPPPDVQSFDVVRLSDGTRKYSWVLGVVPPDIAGVQIRYGVDGTDWFNMTPLHEDVLQASPAELNAPPAGTWLFGIKMVDTSGNESVNALFILRTLGQERLEGVAFSDDAGLALWPGTKFNCHLANATFPPALLEPDDTATWDTLPLTWDGYIRWILGPKTPISYEHTALDAGFELEFSPDAITAGDGVLVTELAWSLDDVTYTDWAEVSSVRQTAIRARYLKARVTGNPTPEVAIPTITRLLVLMRAPTVTYEIQDLPTASLPATSVLGVGDVRLPIEPGRFTLIRHIALTFNGMGPGWTWELVDKDTAAGPRVRMYNADGVLSHATVDAVIRGL